MIKANERGGKLQVNLEQCQINNAKERKVMRENARQSHTVADRQQLVQGCRYGA